MNEAAQFLCAEGPHESLNLWPWGGPSRKRGLHPVAFKGWRGPFAALDCAALFRGRNQRLGIAVGAGFLGEVCQRTTNCATARPERLQFISADMQRMFAEGTEWKMPWLDRVLPNILSITSTHSEKTVFTRFIPAHKPGQGVGMWRHYYERWGSMTIDQLGPEMIGLVPDLAKFVPPARTYDKHVYSPWTGTDLHQQLRGAGIDTVIITGGETDVCVLATMLGAIDWGFRIIRDRRSLQLGR